MLHVQLTQEANVVGELVLVAEQLSCYLPSKVPMWRTEPSSDVMVLKMARNGIL